jgi:hypothetical protein
LANHRIAWQATHAACWYSRANEPRPSIRDLAYAPGRAALPRVRRSRARVFGAVAPASRTHSRGHPTQVASAHRRHVQRARRRRGPGRARAAPVSWGRSYQYEVRRRAKRLGRTCFLSIERHGRSPPGRTLAMLWRAEVSRCRNRHPTDCHSIHLGVRPREDPDIEPVGIDREYIGS